MKRTALLSLLALAAVGCAHAPTRGELPGAGGPGFQVFRGAAVDAILAARSQGSILDQKLVGSPSYLGTIDYTGTSKTNHQATTPFNNTSTGSGSSVTGALCGKLALLQPSTQMYLLPTNANNGTVSATNGVKLQPDERVIILFRDFVDCWIAAIRVTASGDLKVWELN